MNSVNALPAIPSYQSRVNTVIRGLLRVPLLNRLVGKRLMTIEVVGRKTGKTYDVPVAYTRHSGRILVGTRKLKWVGNIGPDIPVRLRFGARSAMFDAVVHTDETNVVRLFEVVATDNHQNAKFNGIEIGPDGRANLDSVRAAWRAGAVVIEFSPR